MPMTLGIDTGGTYTDAVIMDHERSHVLAQAKALTTHENLSEGIREAILAVLNSLPGRFSPAEIELVGLSTTLATNAIVEGHGSPICLLLIGYDAELIRQYRFEKELVAPDVVYIRGGHNVQGDEVEPLDETAIKEAVSKRCGHVEAFAVSGYFSVRNPAHELRARALIEDVTGQEVGAAVPITCGHELTTQLDSVRRATTTALNAGLIPLLQELIATVRRTLDELEISAPLMVVKGDGSLVRTEWAMQRPIETILSGPAASVVGAWHLAGERDVWVVDVGGTTTDIARLQDGQPKLNPEGAQVGCWRTMVEAVDIHTVGLGGDSQVHLNKDRLAWQNPIAIGPRRIIPLCLLASHYPQVLDELQRQSRQTPPPKMAGRFILAQRQAAHSLARSEKELLERLAAGPQSITSLLEGQRFQGTLVYQLEKLAAKHLISFAGFTPTDAVHVLGGYSRWNREAAQLGADLLSAEFSLSAEEFCRQVVTGVSERITTELLGKVLSQEVKALPDWKNERTATAMLARVLAPSICSALECQLTLKHPIIAIGAPVEAYLPRVAEHMHTELVIPEYAHVANAVGAIAGGVVLRMHIVIQFLEEREHSFFRVYLPDGNRDFHELEQAVEESQKLILPSLKEKAKKAGAEHVEIVMNRRDQRVLTGQGALDELCLGAELYFTATGRPGMA